MEPIANDIRILEEREKEKLVLLKDVGRYAPVPCSESSAQRWARGLGTGGIVLPSAKLGGRRYTTLPLLHAFFAEQQGPQKASSAAPPKPVGMKEKERIALRSYFGMPTPKNAE